MQTKRKLRIALSWAALALVVAVPLGASMLSPLLAWRDPVYIVAGFAGVSAMALMLCQPLLAAGYLPGLSLPRARRLHRWVGFTLLLLVMIHVAGLWVTSPPDIIDALLFVSPTPFSYCGVIAMWGVLVVACLVGFRRRLGLRARIWRLTHKSLAAGIVTATVLHALLIEGTMESISKAMLSGLLVLAALLALAGVPARK